MFSVRFAINLTFLTGILSCLTNASMLEEEKCINDLAQESHLLFVSGVPGKVEASEPLHVDEITGELVDPMLSFKFKLKNIYLHGLKDCIPSLVKIDIDQLDFDYHMWCPYVLVIKDFEVDGHIANFPVMEAGDSEVTLTDIDLKLHGDLSVNEEDGKKYYQVINVVENVLTSGEVEMETKSFTEGNSKKHKSQFDYIHDNPRKVQQAFQPYTLRGLMEKFVKNINDYLRLLPEDIAYFKKA